MSSVKEITQDVVCAIVQQHYLPAQELRELEQMTEGWQSAVWRFATTKNHYLLKIYEFGIRTRAEIEDEIAFYAFLNQQGLRVPIVYPPLTEDLLIQGQWDEQVFYAILMKAEMLTSWQPETVTVNEWRKIGLYLAHLHLIALTYPQLYQQPKRTEDELAQENHAVVWQEGFFGAIAQSSLACLFAVDELAGIEQLSTTVTRFVNTQPIAMTLTYALIHADLQVDHVRFLPDGTVYTFDYEGKRWGAIANDLGRFLTAIYGESAIDFDRWETLKGQLITAYCQAHPLTRVDIQQVDLFALRYLQMMLYYFSWGATETNAQLIIPTVRRFLQLGAYLLKQLSHIDLQ